MIWTKGNIILKKNAIIAVLSKADKGILREENENECIDANMATPIYIGGLNSFHNTAFSKIIFLLFLQKNLLK